MKHIVAGLMAAALLSACGGGSSNPFEPAEDGTPVDGGETPTDTVTPTTPVAVPAALAGNVQSISFDAQTGTVSVVGLNLDEVPITAIYRRRPGLDRDGYLAFTAQDDPLDRHFTAYVGQSNNSGAVRAGAVGSPGPRNRFFVGGFFERDGEYTPPSVTETTGLVSYAGKYVGVTNGSDAVGADLLAVPAGTPNELLVPQSNSVTGDVFVNADFADNSVEGNIFNRRLIQSAADPESVTFPPIELPSLVLVSTGITANGTFNGSVEYDLADPRSNSPTPTSTGSYGGVFGGPNAEGVAGVVNLTGFDGVSNPLGFENELETGIFVLDQCGAAVSSPICATVNPDSGTP
ncbi:thymidylate synthase [Roseovarius sp.]|uniref:thymidylate synthase n=1 Tax=Roseovarius sp. TaxID=1486281 RepID=UPI003A97DB4E